jgi:hypothetical protein
MLMKPLKALDFSPIILKSVGHYWPAVRSDRTVLERLGQIIEMGQRVAKGTTH